MDDDTLLLAQEFISYESVAGKIKAQQDILDLAVSKLHGFTVERFESDGIRSALVYASPKRPKIFRVILNGHLDVTPGKPEQYRPHIEGDRLYGAGAMDMKSSVACLISAFKKSARSVDYPLGLQLTTDEEIGGEFGTKYQLDQGVRADFVIAGESTGLNIAHMAKGVLWVKVTFSGTTAHSAYPWTSHNPVWDMYEFLAQIKQRFPLPLKENWATTIAVSNIETGNFTFNKTPSTCTAWLDVRYTAEDSASIVDSIKSLASKNGNVDIITKESAMHTDAKDLFVRLLQDTTEAELGHKIKLYGAQGSSDARHYAKIGGKGVEFGPIGGGIGTDQEWISIKSLHTYLRVLDNFLASVPAS